MKTTKIKTQTTNIKDTRSSKLNMLVLHGLKHPVLVYIGLNVLWLMMPTYTVNTKTNTKTMTKTEQNALKTQDRLLNQITPNSNLTDLILELVFLLKILKFF